ncbi:MAG TPA: 50S ribosomal protein L24 [candidate division Zixibacteria bacterium]|nr:50S ribosomal protein L24 [candidate division Zixibacteria bacterium]
MAMRIKKGDTVYVRTGSAKGKTGRVLHVDYEKNTVLVEGVAMRKRRQRPSQKNPKGGIISIEAPIHLSNVALYSSTLSGPTKTTNKAISDGGKVHKVRVCRKTGEQI